MNFVIDNWQLAVAAIIGGFVLGLCFRKFWQAVCALTEFEYRDQRCREQAARIQIEYDRVMTMSSNRETLHQLEKRFGYLGQEFEKLRRECGK